MYGKKQWTLYKKIPVLLPYHNEQVGKADIAVPLDVLHGPKAMEDWSLEAGAILYIPRGMVHSARCGKESGGSIHVTIAVPTSHWSVRESLSLFLTTEPRADATDSRDQVTVLSEPHRRVIKETTAQAMKCGENNLLIKPCIWRGSMPLVMIHPASRARACPSQSSEPDPSNSECNHPEGRKVERVCADALSGLLQAAQQKQPHQAQEQQSSIDYSSLAMALLHQMAEVQSRTIAATDLWREKERKGLVTKRQATSTSSCSSCKRVLLSKAAGQRVTWGSRIQWSTEKDKTKLSLAEAEAEGCSQCCKSERKGLMASEVIADAVGAIVGGVKAGDGPFFVCELVGKFVGDGQQHVMCNMTTLSLVREIVEQGAFELAE